MELTDLIVGLLLSFTQSHRADGKQKGRNLTSSKTNIEAAKGGGKEPDK